MVKQVEEIELHEELFGSPLKRELFTRRLSRRRPGAGSVQLQAKTAVKSEAVELNRGRKKEQAAHVTAAPVHRSGQVVVLHLVRIHAISGPSCRKKYGAQL
jgi:hypothetical protein